MAGQAKDVAQARPGARRLISLFDAAGARLALAYNGLTVNSPSDTIESTSGAEDAYRINAVASKTALDYVLEIQSQRPGAEIYNMHKVTRVVTLSGRIVGPTRAKLHDKIEAFAEAFDGDKIRFNNASNPFLPLTFTTLTTDTTNYPSGQMACKYLAMPGAIFEPVVGGKGYTARISMPMLLRDPRRYLVAQSTKTGAGTTTNLGGFRSWPTLTITMAGAGSATYRITNTATTNTTILTLDLSGRANADVVVVDFEHRTIKVNGTLTMSLYVSGGWTEAEPGNNVLTYANTTNATSVFSYFPAFSV